MNNNRNNNNNRRRGRGNRPQSGGNQNRIDSRSRGNAPQMLDKYKKLAQDAAHNGDRVQAEYYLQFADHYFRVIADNKSRMDEQRGGAPRRDDREDDDIDDIDEFDIGGRQQQARGDRERGNDQQRSDRSGEARSDRAERSDRGERSERNADTRRPRGNRRDSEAADPRPVTGNEGEREGAAEPGDNPFIRDSRERTREGGGDDGERRPRARRGNARDRDAQPVSDAGEIDAAALPPSFSAPMAAAPSEDGEGETATRRKLPPRRRKPAATEGDEGDALKVAG